MWRIFSPPTLVDWVFNRNRILSARVAPAEAGRYDTAVKKKLFFGQVLQRVKALPGVITATVSLSVPPLWGAGSFITVPGKSHSERWESMFDLCSDGYIQTLGLRLLRGRLLSETDIDSGRHVAVVNQAFARAYFGSENPLGQKIKFNAFDEIPETPHDAY